MAQKNKRTPRNYDGSATTMHQMSKLLTRVLTRVSEQHQARPDLILAAWPSVIGPQLAPMTQAVSFDNGVLRVKVKNSTLYSLLCRHDKLKILKDLQQKFPKANIQNVMFSMG